MNKNEQPLRHEDFEVKEDYRGERIKAYRPKRLSADATPCFLDIGGQLYSVVDYSPFGVAVNGSAHIMDRKELSNVPFIVGNVEIDLLDLRQVRIEPRGQEVVVAYEVVNRPLNLDRLDGTTRALSIIQKHAEEVMRFNELSVIVKATVLEAKELLQSLKNSLDRLEKNIRYSSRQHMADTEESICSVVGAYISNLFAESFRRFAESLSSLPQESRQKAIDFLRHSLEALVYQAPFANRAFYKPLGYAGDYEMMNLIYRNEELGTSLYAKCLQNYFITQPSAQAVRNRAEYLARKIHQTVDACSGMNELAVLSVACGPAKEWEVYLNGEAPSNGAMMVDLIDQDAEALDAAHARLRALGNQAEMRNIRFNYYNKAIKNIIASGVEKQYDLIYTAGLFDYLSDSVAYVAAKRLYRALKPGGTLIIGNFNTDNPNGVVMDYALDWYLIYRSEEDLDNLFSRIGPMTIEREPLDINLFCVLKKD